MQQEDNQRKQTLSKINDNESYSESEISLLLIADRNQQINDIESDVLYQTEIMKDLASITNKQQEHLDNIHDNIEKSNALLYESNWELKEAEMKTIDRRLMIGVAVTSGIVILASAGAYVYNAFGRPSIFRQNNNNDDKTNNNNDMKK